MDLSIIIVNYNSASYVLHCIKSIIEQTTKHSYEIIIVDNASTDNSEERIKNNSFTTITWLQTGYNSGFARANNVGIKASKGKYILLLNADTIVLEQALDQTIALFEQQQNIAACGIQLLNEDGSNQISGAKNILGGLNNLLPLPYLGSLVRWLGYALKTTVPSIEHVQATTQVDWIIGAFILTTKEVIAKAGLLDEDFFMYSEEMEWCSRLKKQGNLYLFAAPKVTHFGGGSSKKFYNTNEWENGKNLWNHKGLQIMLSAMLRIRKEFGMAWFLIHLFFYVIEIPIFFIGAFIEKWTTSKNKFSLQDVKKYTSNVGYILKQSIAIMANKHKLYKV